MRLNVFSFFFFSSFLLKFYFKIIIVTTIVFTDMVWTAMQNCYEIQVNVQRKAVQKRLFMIFMQSKLLAL